MAAAAQERRSNDAQRTVRKIQRKPRVIELNPVFARPGEAQDLPHFSRPGAQGLIQYYLLLRLGRKGFRNVRQTSQDVASSLRM